MKLPDIHVNLPYRKHPSVYKIKTKILKYDPYALVLNNLQNLRNPWLTRKKNHYQKENTNKQAK